MQDDANEYGDTIDGVLIKVQLVESDTGRVFGRLANGHSTMFTINFGPHPEPGDVLVRGNSSWAIAPQSAWISVNLVGVVRSIPDEESVILEETLSLKAISNPKRISVTVGNTIEYNETEGVVRVVAEQPIRTRPINSTDDFDLAEFKVGSVDFGPKFCEFGGYPDVVARAKELIKTQFRHRKSLEKIGVRPVRGVLLTGPPGTGKTHLARIIAHESKADFYLVSGPSIVTKWVGDTEAILRRLFHAAGTSKSGRAIIFFDEIDSIAERRTEDSHEASKRLVAQLLTLMDGFDNKARNVMVIAATNRAESLDPAITRPGRFDWEIYLGSPDHNDRFEILKISSRGKKVAKDLPLHDIAMSTEGWSAAELTSIWSEAASIAISDRRDVIAGEDLALAHHRISQRPRRPVTGE